MDYTISNNAKLFDELVEVLERHRGEKGVAGALDDLRAAKTNYVQRSIDHMLGCLILTVHDLLVAAPNPKLMQELGGVIHGYYTWVLGAGSRLAEKARQYELEGGRPLSQEEILREVAAYLGEAEVIITTEKPSKRIYRTKRVRVESWAT
jgi:hypothetical protein